MKTTIPLIIALIVIVAGYNALISLHGAAVVSNGLECDDTMTLVSNPAETTAEDSIFVSSNVQQRTPLQTKLSKEWVIQGQDSCSQNTLTEWSCTSSRAGAKVISGKVLCKYGCTQGHCILPTCYDPDISQPYTTAAITTGLLLSDSPFLGVPPPTQDAKGYADYCSSDLILAEYSCVQLGGGSHVKSLQKSCKSLGKNFKCREGRCVSPELKG